MLAIDDPLSNSTNTVIDDIDLTFLVLYTIEMCLKIIGHGFFFNKGAYLRDAWNILDFIIIVTAYIPYLVDN